MSDVKYALPTREEVPGNLKWRLEDIYATDEDFEKDMARIRDMLPAIAEWSGRLGESSESLRKCLVLRDEILETATRAYVYAHMRKDEDNSRSRYQAMASRTVSLATEASAATAFIIPEILDIPESVIHQFLNEDEGLSLYRHHLEDIARRRVHTLSKEQETLLAMAGEMAEGPQNIFTMLNNADIRFPSIQDEDGNVVELTKGRYLRFMESRDRRVRHDAFKALYSTYGKLSNTMGASLGASLKKDAFFAKARKHESSLAASLFENNIPVDVYDNVVSAVRSRLDVMHRYVGLRKKALGLDELHMWDMYAPIVPEIKIDVPYDEACATVEESLQPLGEEYISVVKSGFAGGWIDIPENRGKTSGAYAWGVYGRHPYILLNWQNTVDNMFTLAHEMGHAMHFHYTWATQPFVYSDYSMFVAEVASTVNEVLLTKHLLKTTSDTAKRAYYLNHYLEGFRGTVIRQTMLAEFERTIHARTQSGEGLTSEDLSAIYGQLNQDYHGPLMVADEEISLEWMRIPHFYRAFYVYQYATGFCAAVSLTNKILSEGEPAVSSYIDFLRGGNSAYSIDLLRSAGVDMATTEPILVALDEFADSLAEMERILS